MSLTSPKDLIALHPTFNAEQTEGIVPGTKPNETNCAEDFLQSAELALIVFSGDASLRWLRLLKPGFRHCFALFRFNGTWILYDPISSGTHLRWIGPCPIKLMIEAFLIIGKQAILYRPVHTATTPLPWRPYTCVEALKRVLGIDEPHIFTPWQLFQFLVIERERQRRERRS